MRSASSILIIDDTPANLAVVVGSLESQGYRVAVAQDGEEGLRRAALIHPQLILLDVMMPGIDGFEVCRRLKSKPETREIPVIFMTALAESADKLNGFGVGAVDYVTKPFQIDEVLARVDTHLKLHAMQVRLAEQNAELQRLRRNLEQQVAERTAELVASNERLSLTSFALSRVHEAAYLIDASGRLVYVNEEAGRALGYSPEELLKMSVPDFDPDLTPERWSRHARDFRNRAFSTFEARHRRRDGTVFPVEVYSSYFEHDGKAYNLALARDISEHKDAQRRLQESYELLRQLSSRRESAREEERRRIAREIHDELGQYLTALRMGVSALRIEFGHDNAALNERVCDLMALADQTITVVREVAASLRPAVLDAGLAAAIEWLASEFEKHAGIPCRVALPPERLPLDDERASALFRIVQESLTNVARHAGAKSVEIELATNDGNCLLEIRDDGRGFDPATVRPNSFGLVGMRERAMMLGGEIFIDGVPGKGTTVRTKIPLQHRREKT